MSWDADFPSTHAYRVNKNIRKHCCSYPLTTNFDTKYLVNALNIVEMKLSEFCKTRNIYYITHKMQQIHKHLRFYINKYFQEWQECEISNLVGITQNRWEKMQQRNWSLNMHAITVVESDFLRENNKYQYILVDFPHIRPVMQKSFPYHTVIM